MITTTDFHNYLISLDLFRLTIKETPSAFEAIISQDTRPKQENFTQILKHTDGSFWVRLSKKDLQNEKITNGFFK